MSVTQKDSKKRRRGRRQHAPSSVDVQKSAASFQHDSLLIKLSDDAPTWYQAAEQIPGRNSTILTHPVDDGKGGKLQQTPRNLVDKYRLIADELYRKEVQLFGKTGAGDKDMAWIQSTISKGTLKDRIAAMSVVVSTNPVHKFHALDGLMQMAGCLSEGQTNSRVAQLAAEAMEDLFLNTFLPEDRKLITLDQRPLHLYEKHTQVPSEGKGKPKTKDTTKRTLSPKVLLLWRFEEMVKEKYYLFMSQYIGYTLREGTEQQKIPTLTSAATFLRGVPEGEATLLQMICNKLGDPAKKVASAAAHELRKLLDAHPAMQSIVAREVQQLAHRPQLASKALYNCITFLNQLKFSSHDKEDGDEDVSSKEVKGTDSKVVKQSLPASLISTYFRLFEVTVKKATKDEDASSMKGRLLSALLSGVNRAHPYLPAKDQEMEDHIDALYRVVYKAPPSACTQALLLLFHLAVGSKLDNEQHNNDKISNFRSMSDQEKARKERFYETLYSRLGRVELLRSGKQSTMWFNLVFKSMKYDKNTTRVISYAKMLLSTAVHCGPSVATAALFLVSEVAKVHPDLAACFSQKLAGPDGRRSLDYREQIPHKALKLDVEEQEESGDTKQLAPLWEVSVLLQHYHPSVTTFAQQIGAIEYPGDPLKDFALAPFLDKFAYRNPKTSKKENGKPKSIAARHVKTSASSNALPFNDPSFLDQKEIASQDHFFYQFFAERAKRDKIKGIDRIANKKKDEEEDYQDDLDDAMGRVDSKEFDAYEQTWDTDDEEEAFVDGLAQKIIEDSMDSNELGPDNLDDEDPDMDDWGDLDDDDDGEVDIDDDYVDFDHNNDDKDSDDETPAPNHGEDEDAFMDDDTDSDGDAELNEEDVGGLMNGNDMDLALIADEDESDTDVEEVANKKRKKPLKDQPLFASAKDFEEKINDEFYAVADDKETKSDGGHSKKRRKKKS
mmetsp:Transcript_24187/g.67061  ORF Transcript_24187/g.67061 Transcript_24187/m.67061 type:complete len:950 (+) Transcript_24187:2-2851(+)